MAKVLSEFLDLTPQQARAQWAQILRRSVPGPGKRQEPFLPLEVILSYGLFFIMNPHSFGGANMGRAPSSVHALAAVFKRPASSINYKMMNLDFSQKNGAKWEPQLYAQLAASPDGFAHLYRVILGAAYESGLSESQVPDFLGWAGKAHTHLLYGQDELGTDEMQTALREQSDDMRLLEGQVGLNEADTVRVVEQRVRMGQHRFAKEVLENYHHTCAFCGFSPNHLHGHRMLLASHIKPWRDSTNKERLDSANGIAACPIHDSAFDTGLLTVNGGLRIHLSGKLSDSLLTDAGADHFFGESLLAPRLIVPGGSNPPDKRYLEYHKSHVFQREAVA